jgi:FtsP/CotA-like multicopper oxidase with cupredoxin domain
MRKELVPELYWALHLINPRDRASDVAKGRISGVGSFGNHLFGVMWTGKLRIEMNISWSFWRKAFLVGLAVCAKPVCAKESAEPMACPRPALESAITSPAELRSKDGVLRVELSFRNSLDEHKRVRYCYVDKDGHESPTLRLHAGDLLVLRLKNELRMVKAQAGHPMEMGHAEGGSKSACAEAEVTWLSTNLHFHGLMIPPVCHQDDVLHTAIQPSKTAYEFQFRVPMDQPAGLYWYHPHVHGLTREQVVGGASGALIIEGIEKANSHVAGLPERVLVIRDEDLLNPNAKAMGTQQAPDAVLDRDGDAKNTGTGGGTPARDLSVNFVSSPFPEYRGGLIRMRAGTDEFWRVVNASSITYLSLQLLVDGKPQAFGIAGVDGAPVNVTGGSYVLWQTHLGIPPGGRSEFVVKGLPAGTKATFITRTVNTGPGGENDPTRELAAVEVDADVPVVGSKIPEASPDARVSASGGEWLGNVQPVRTRHLYFSEDVQDPKDPNSPTSFYLTVEGQPRVMFDPKSTVPNIVVQQGDVEDWIIENRSQELHDFHIHQVHFLMLEWFGVPINEPFLRDTVPVPFWDGQTKQYPTVKLRMDFRSGSAVGIFPYHCHLLEHEDGGMMGLIEVKAAPKK